MLADLEMCKELILYRNESKSPELQIPLSEVSNELLGRWHPVTGEWILV